MYVLGLNSGTIVGFGHDPSACLMKDGEILSAIEEERFLGIKRANNFFPYNSIKFCLEREGITIDDVDKVGIYVKPDLINILKRTNLRSPITLLGSFNFYRKIKFDAIEKFKTYFKRDITFEYINHHDAHAASTYRLSGFKRANVISIDGSGERECTVLYYADNGEMERLREFYYPNSLGVFYSSLTENLGLGEGGEGKLMGLAPYGKNLIDLSDVIKIGYGYYKINQKYFFGYGWVSELFLKRFGEPKLTKRDFTEKEKDLAYSFQYYLEKAVKSMAEWLYDHTGCKNFCLAGGVALNCKMNGMLLKQDFVDNIFIQPAAGDAGTSVGVAAELSYRNGAKIKPMKHAYYGSDFSNEEIKQTLDMAKVKYDFCDDIEGTVADLLAKNKIVAWFQGRMEFGPRALGARSILTSPIDPNMKDTLNHFVKHRESFRPFCPSMLLSASKKYLEGAYPSPFMILSFNVKEKKRNDIPAVVHVDGSVRPQTVTEDTNPRYYKLIKNFGKETGVPVVLNTSLNDKGQPIIRTPEGAIKMFYGTGVDALAIGNYLLIKK